MKQPDFSIITGKCLPEVEAKLNTYILMLGHSGVVLSMGALNNAVLDIGLRCNLTVKEIIYLAMSATRTCDICRVHNYQSSSSKPCYN